jgi:outer membrane immunogenic protein
MKKLLLGTIGLVALAFTGPAVAADLPPAYSKAPPTMMPALYDWSGLYIGINGGGGWAHKCWSLATTSANVLLTPPAPEGCHDATGGTVGGQFGYRLQSDSWVFGVETQGNWASFKGSNTNLFIGPPAVTDNTRVDGFMTFTGQVGYSWNTVLGYVKGGGAVVSDRFATYSIPGNLLVDRVGDTRWGGVVGAGLEYSFAPNWSAAVEYNHMFMGTKSVTAVTPTGVFNATDRIGQNMDVVTARVNYRWGGPVVAKY